MKRIKEEVRGQYLNNQVKFEVVVNNKTSRLVLFLHGAYSSPYESKKTKIQYLAKELSKDASVGFYQTSRLIERQIRPNLCFEDYINKGFNSKTFTQEWEDVQLAYKAIIGKVKKQLKTKRLKISLVGFSLGGVMSLLLSESFSEVNSIVMFGSSSSFIIPGDDWHLLRTMPTVARLNRIARNFMGSLSMVYAEKDEYVNKKMARQWFDSFEESRIKRWIEIKGADHRFKTINNKNREGELQSLLKQVILEAVEI